MYIKENAPTTCKSFLTYFERTWVGRRQVVPVGIGSATMVTWTNPLYPIPQWNMHEATLQGKPRTNNTCEGMCLMSNIAMKMNIDR